MKNIYLVLLTNILFLSCSTTHSTTAQVKGDRMEVIEYKNFKNDRIETYSGVAITRKYFEDNKLVSVKFFDANDEPIKNKKPWEKKNSEWRFEYDEKNNFVKQLAYNHLGENCVVENWGNSAIEIFKYNDKNQLIEKANYNKNMELVGLGDIRDAITRYGYNDDGQLIWKKSFNDRDKFLANGYCYSKFEYNKDGTLKKHIYLYDENKINTYSIYTYEDKRLKKEESFNDANEKVGYEIYDYDENGKIIRLEDWYYKRDKPNIKKRQISLELEGWIIPEGDLANFNFENFGEGKYIISVNSSGKIENIEPDEYKGGTKEFAMEVYSKFRNISLERSPDLGNMKLKGKLKVSIIFQEIGRFYDIERVLNPDPDKNY